MKATRSGFRTQSRELAEESSSSPARWEVVVVAESLECGEMIARTLEGAGLAVASIAVANDWRDKLSAVPANQVGSLRSTASPAPHASGVVAAFERVGWSGDLFQLGPLAVDARRAVADLAGVQLDLSDMLFALLLDLCSAWRGTGAASFVRAEWDDIYFLRRAFGSHSHLIVTGRGRGYRLVNSLDEARKLADERARRRGPKKGQRGKKPKKPRAERVRMTE